MAAMDKMSRGLDEIIAETRSSAPRGRRGRGNRGRDRAEQPRDGVRKSYRHDSGNPDGEWVHDRYDDHEHRRAPAPRRRRESPEEDHNSTRLRVENIHYDLTEDDLDELFRRIGPVTKLQLRYDRAGRSEGTAYVSYENREDALEAVKQFDGANANGQPIRLQLLSGRGGPSRNPFDSAVRPLSERVTLPGNRARSHSPQNRYSQEDAVRKGIDRYIPGQRSRSRSPAPRRRGGGRRPGARREGGGREGGGREGGGREESGRGDSNRGARGNARGKKTQEELDAEMADYFGSGDGDQPQTNNQATATETSAVGQSTTVANTEDIDMIE